MKHLKLSTLLLASATAALGGAAHGQTAGDTRLEEIVVTAQRRSENLQSVPIAVTAVTAATAAKLGISDPQNFTQLVPGFSFTRASAGAMPFIRGVGNQATVVGNEPSVAIFVDDVYIPTGQAAVFDFNNIEIVEVLKGPQGTLFGRNATGGVLNIRTKDPTHTPTLDADVGYANYETVSAHLYASTGLSDTVAVNLAGFYSDQNKGWGKNQVTGEDSHLSWSFGVRGKLLYEPTDDTTVLLSASFNRRKSDMGMGGRVVDGLFGRNGYDPKANGAGFWDTWTTFGQFYNTRSSVLSGKIRHDFGRAALVSITAYGRNYGFHFSDTDAAPTNYVNSHSFFGGKTFTQELQLVSTDEGPLKWILGAYFMKDNSNYSGFSFGDVRGTRIQFTNNDQRTTSYSAFSQATMEILPRTNMTLGLRYTSDKRYQHNGYTTQTGLPPVPQAGPFEDSATFSRLTGRAALDYKFTDDLMGYVAYNRGFKSGVYNLPAFTIASRAAEPPVNPEDISAYTAGFKSEFLDHRVRLNAEAYLYKYKNIQVQNILPTGGNVVLVNAAAATIKGFEVEASVIPVNNLTITANVSVAKGTYDRFPNGPTFFPLPPNAPIPIPPGCEATVPTYPTGTAGTPMVQRACDLAGRKVVNLPPFSTNVSAIYTIPLASGTVDLAASWAHGGRSYFEVDNLSFTRQVRTDIVNGSVQWSAPNRSYTVRLWANNITGEKYWIYKTNSGSSGTKGDGGAPRTYGITVGVHY